VCENLFNRKSSGDDVRSGKAGARGAMNAAANETDFGTDDKKKKTTPDASKLPKAGADPKFSLPPIEKRNFQTAWKSGRFARPSFRLSR
jgi:hypothetical protein